MKNQRHQKPNIIRLKEEKISDKKTLLAEAIFLIFFIVSSPITFSHEFGYFKKNL